MGALTSPGHFLQFLGIPWLRLNVEVEIKVGVACASSIRRP